MFSIKHLILFFAFVVLQQNVRAQGIIDTQYELYTIRHEVQQINKDSLFKIKELDNDEFIDGTDNGSELKGYFEKDSICKMTTWVGLSVWTLQTEYYFKHEKLIFAYEKQLNTADSTGAPYAKNPTLIFEGRYYLNNNQIILRLEKGRRYDDFRGDIVKMLLDDSSSYMKMLKAKKK